ncbi:Alpha/Beta hydrolase protein [Butyriboletus roseoflavus]|nr:Alpha/Beta hydrolase protein [Butyriboletus roseoflavus]
MSTEKYDPIISVNLTSNKTPIFFVHTGVDKVLIFINLNKYFQNEQPFYAFHTLGFKPGHPFFSSIDKMVSSYIAVVKQMQPHSLYTITSYSHGGVIVFEIVKRLEAMGDEVKFTSVINIPPNITD